MCYGKNNSIYEQRVNTRDPMGQKKIWFNPSNCLQER